METLRSEKDMVGNERQFGGTGHFSGKESSQRSSKTLDPGVWKMPNTNGSGTIIGVTEGSSPLA
jgi:hypothetical protein